jgi:3-oxoacyl-[acyl-carrier protein] reductase
VLGLLLTTQAAVKHLSEGASIINIGSVASRITPELMSTHPADQTRITQLEKLMPAALEVYRKALEQQP